MGRRRAWAVWLGALALLGCAVGALGGGVGAGAGAGATPAAGTGAAGTAEGTGAGAAAGSGAAAPSGAVAATAAPGRALTAGLAPAHLPHDPPVPAGEPLPAQVTWLDGGTLAYTSQAGIELLPVVGGPAAGAGLPAAPATAAGPPAGGLATLAGTFWRVAAAPGGQRLAWWGPDGIGLATREPLARGAILWAVGDLAAWAAGQLAALPPVAVWVEDLQWSPDGRRLLALVQGKGGDGRAVSGVAVLDADRGGLVQIIARSSGEGPIRAARWHNPESIVIQYDGSGGNSTVVVHWIHDGLEKSLGTLPSPYTLADLQGSTLLFLPNPVGTDVDRRPQVARLEAGLRLQPVGEEGQRGLLSPRDGQFVPLPAGARGAAVAPDGGALAVLVPQGDGSHHIHLIPLAPPASGAFDLHQAPPLSVRLAPPPDGAGPPPGLADVLFASPQAGWGATVDGGIYRTDDGGATWRLAYRAEGVELRRLVAAGVGAAPAGSQGAGAVSTGAQSAGPLAAAIQPQGGGVPPVAAGVRPGVATPLLAIGRLRDTGAPVLVRDGGGSPDWSVLEPAGLPPEATPLWPSLNFHFPTAQVGYAALDPDVTIPSPLRQALLATADGGRTWEARPLPAGFSLTGGVHFVTADRGFVTAYGPEGAAILATADGGRTWQVAHRSRVPLYAVFFLDVDHGFAGGGLSYKAEVPPRQYLLATRDGGRTWEEVYASQGREGAPVARLSFADPLTGWVTVGVCTMGASPPCPKALLVTADGGRTWQATGRPAMAWSAVGTHAWTVVGEGEARQAVIHRTADAGRTWAVLWHPGAVAVRRVQFVDALTGWIETNLGLFRTRDGGATWQPQPLGHLPGAEPGWAPALPLFTGPDTAVAQRGEGLAQSRDGGLTWAPLPLPEGGWVSAFAFAGPERGWVALPGGLYATRNGGRSWERQVPGLVGSVRLLAFADDRRGLAVADRHLFLTADGGRTWSGRPLGDVRVNAASFTPDGHIWLAGAFAGSSHREEGALLHSADGGRTWEAYRLPDVFPVHVSFASAAIGWLAGWVGGRPDGLLVTRDGGRTWQQVWPDVKGR